MEIKYNTLICKFVNYEDLDDFIVVDDQFKSNFFIGFYYCEGYKVVKVWKDGRITNNKDKELKMVVLEKEEGKRVKYWKYGRGKYDFVEVKKIIWEIYSTKYKYNSTLLLGDKNKGLINEDGDFNNVSLSNLVKYKITNEGTKIFDNNNNYFDFEFIIQRDQDDFVVVDEPVILSNLPDFEIYRNGQVVDRREKSKIYQDKKGYEMISYKGRNYFVHRLVAMSYLKKKDEFDLVNHIDGDRFNNDVNNLEWVNNTYNTLHGSLSIKMNNEDNIIKFHNKSSGIKGWISLTSKHYREFIKTKIYQESFMDSSLWIFSHKSPLFLLYIPFSRTMGLNPNTKSFGYQMGSNYCDDNFNKAIINTFYNHNNSKYKEYFEGDLFHSEKTYNFVRDNINNYILRQGDECHLFMILKNLGIDFDLYYNWLFDELKKLENDDVGFIFFNEMEDYLNLMRKGDIIYLNDILKKSLKCNSERVKENIPNRNIFFDKYCHRVVEIIPTSFGSKIIGFTNKNEINNKYETLFMFDCWEGDY